MNSFKLPLFLLLFSIPFAAAPFIPAPPELAAAPTSYRLAAFDAAGDLLQDRSLALFDIVGTRETWTKSEVQKGYRYEFAQVRDFASTARALLADAEASLKECEDAAGTSPPDPPTVPDPPTGGAVLEYEEAPVFRSGTLQDYADELGSDAFAKVPYAEKQSFGKYAHLADLTPAQLTGTRLGGSVRIGRSPNGWKSSNGFTIPDDWSNDRVVWNSTKATWDEYLPKWGIRAYDVRGEIRNLTQFRAGDFTRGREGHAIYLNVFEKLLIENVHAIQCGGQALQIVWRINDPDETIIPPELHDQASYKITIRDSSAIDCGTIYEGSASRASWPLTFYNPGQDLDLIRFTVRTKLQAFQTSGGPKRSRGGVYIGPGQIQRTTNVVRIESLDIEVTESDRDELRLESVASGLILSPRIVDVGGTAEIGIVDDCGRIEIRNAIEPLTVIIRDKAKHRPLTYHKIKAGENFVWMGAQ